MGSNEIAFKGGDADRSHPPDRFVSRWVWPRVIKEAADLRRIQRPAISNGERIREAIPPPPSPGFYGRIRVNDANDAQSLAAQLFSHGQSRRGKKPSLVDRSI